MSAHDAVAGSKWPIRSYADPAAIISKVVLLILFIGLTNWEVTNRILEFWYLSNYKTLAIFVGIWAISLVALAIVAFLPSFWMRLLWAIPIAASTFMGVLALEVTRVHLTFYDVVLYWAERAHAGNAMEFYADWIVIAGLKTAIGVIAILLPVTFRLYGAPVLMAVPITPFLVIVALLLVQGGRGTRALPEQFTSLAMTGTVIVTDSFGEETERAGVTMKPAGPGLAKHVFLIVEESLRGDFVDLNEPRGTTPFLASEQDRIANFGYAVAGNNCSLFSNLILRYGAAPADVAGSVRKNPPVWRYAKAAGYKTIYLDAQRDSGELQNAMTMLEREDIDHFEQFSDLPFIERDLAVAKRLRALAEAPEPSFVYVNKRGTHFPFSRAYPESIARFHPVNDGNVIGDDREALVNAYKNSVLWSVDHFFKELLADDLKDVAVIYTSDHGQNLLDHDVVMTHCNPSAPHALEGLVPLFVITGDQSLQSRFEEAARVNRHRLSHFQIFPTVLQLTGFDPAEVRERFPAGMLEPIEDNEVVRAFTFGSVVSPLGVNVRWKTMPDDLTTLVPAPQTPSPSLLTN
ncbi:MAG: sulfatase-like hydrolase/transferase [Geminicoccaceae bacterium]